MKTSFIKISANTPRVLGLTLLTIVSISLLSFKANSSRFRLKVANVKERGTLYVSFCTDASEWTENGQFTYEFPASPDGDDTYEINTLPKGTYAIAMFQDLNGNGVLDTNLFGIPKEPYAFSNDVKPVLSAPSFEKCKFQFDSDDQVFSIHLLN